MTPASRISAASRGGECSVSAGASTTRPPASSGTNMSITETSKLSEANCSTASAGPMSHVSIMPSRKLTACRCSTTTPLGRPVDPDV